MDVQVMRYRVRVRAHGVDSKVISAGGSTVDGDSERQAPCSDRCCASITTRWRRGTGWQASDGDILVVPASAIDLSRDHGASQIKTDDVVIVQSQKEVG